MQESRLDRVRELLRRYEGGMTTQDEIDQLLQELQGLLEARGVSLEWEVPSSNRQQLREGGKRASARQVALGALVQVGMESGVVGDDSEAAAEGAHRLVESGDLPRFPNVFSGQESEPVFEDSVPREFDPSAIRPDTEGSRAQSFLFKERGS